MIATAGKRAAFPVALIVAVLWVIGYSAFGPQWSRSGPPSTDLPARPGYRAVWADGRPSERALRNTDVVLEVVYPDSTPFAPHYDDPLRQIAFRTRVSTSAIVVTVLGDALVGRSAAARFVEGAQARVDEVLLDRLGHSIEVGSTLRLSGGHRTRVARTDGTQVVERAEYLRVPKEGGRYLLFMFADAEHAPRAQIGYGNAFEIRGSRLVSMSIPDGGSWRRSADAGRAFTLVRHRAALPLLKRGEWETPTGLAP